AEVERVVFGRDSCNGVWGLVPGLQVMQQQCSRCGERKDTYWQSAPGKGVGERHCPAPLYSSEIAAAWLVVVELRSRGLLLALEEEQPQHWRVAFAAHTPLYASYAPLAICLAALQA